MSREGITAQVKLAAAEIAGSQGLELVDIEYVREGKTWFLRFFVDRPGGGITLDECEAFSKAISPILDELDPVPQGYLLQVSSPGLERPLKKEADFVRFQGRRASLRTLEPVNGVGELQGVLGGFREGMVLLQVGADTLAIPLEKIAAARLLADIPVAGRKNRRE